MYLISWSIQVKLDVASNPRAEACAGKGQSCDWSSDGRGSNFALRLLCLAGYDGRLQTGARLANGQDAIRVRKHPLAEAKLEKAQR
jgi:hypothetical protein